jgi:hypothetical protein
MNNECGSLSRGLLADVTEKRRSMVVCFALTWQVPSAFFPRRGTVAVPAPALHAGRGALPAPSHFFLGRV